MKLEESGAAYKTTYPNDKSDETILIFELPLIKPVTQREFKILQFEVLSPVLVFKNNIHLQLTPPSQENLKILNKLSEEGFEPKDLFYFNADYKKIHPHLIK